MSQTQDKEVREKIGVALQDTGIDKISYRVESSSLQLVDYGVTNKTDSGKENQ